MKAIVTTTINPPTEAIQKFSEMAGWNLYVVGDQKTDSDSYRSGKWKYLSPDYQSQQYPKISNMLGWNNIQRRNIGFLEAVRDGAEIIATVDDDNIPEPDWGNSLVGENISMKSFENHQGLFDPLSVTSISKYWHRGYPLSFVEHRQSNLSSEKTVSVKVEAGMWNGKPDVDAISRLMFGYFNVTICGPFPYSSPNTIFSSQNAFLHKSVMPHYAVLPFVGRMDDIWGCIVMQQRTGNEVAFSRPSTFHDRNHHNPFSDLREEMFGHEHTIKLLLDGESSLPYQCRIFLDEYYKEMTNVTH